MAQRKRYFSAAIDAQGACLGALTVDTRKAERAALIQCLEWCRAQPNGGYFRRQTEGAKGWAYYRVLQGSNEANLILARDVPPVEEMFNALGALVGN